MHFVFTVNMYLQKQQLQKPVVDLLSSPVSDAFLDTLIITHNYSGMELLVQSRNGM